MAAAEATRLLTTLARTRIQQGDGLVSCLTEDEKCALAEELAEIGWRTQSPTVQRTLARVIRDDGTRLGQSSSLRTLHLGESSSALGRNSNALREQSSLSVEQSPVRGAIDDAAAGSGIWSPTAADVDVMERPWHAPATQESSKKRQMAVETVQKLPEFEAEWIIAEDDGNPMTRLRQMANANTGR